jgi:hypothetical protein
VSLQIPINFLTVPGISLSAACFGHLLYEDDKSGDCLSNLLAVGIRRFELDLFWDQGRQAWSFCPVAIPTSVSNNTPALATTLPLNNNRRSLVTPIEPSILSATMPGPSDKPTFSSSIGVAVRQATSASSLGSGTPTMQSNPLTASGTTLGQSLPSTSVIPDTSNKPLVSIGPYTCTTTINLSTVLSQLLDFIQKTENTLEASLLYVTINVHASSNASSPLSPAPKPSALPQGANLLSALISDALSGYLYTPAELKANRANVNGSWYTVPKEYRPIEAFYSVEVNENEIASTEDGWPTEAYIEIWQSKRLLLGFGTVDPQMSEYNFTGDYDAIFRSGYIQDNQLDISATSSGKLTNGCFFDQSTDKLSQLNSSWATSPNVNGFDYPTTPNSDLSPLLNLTSNLTNCGISPLLNTTLLNVTANDDFAPYENYSYASIWSWAPGEPRNQSSSSGVSTTNFRCAMSKISLQGRWVVNDCTTKIYTSCRAIGQPYNWTITTYATAYSFAEQACPRGYTFAVPRTALENSYLFQAVRSADREYDQNGVWVDFNNLDTAGCWVSGSNSTCPYAPASGLQAVQHTRNVVVSTV